MKIITSAAALCLSALMGVTSLAPANAAPLPQAQKPLTENSVVLAGFRNHDGRWVGRRDGWQRDRVIRRHHSWRGHRGYDHYRHGYRRHSDGFWYPLAAFGAGAIIGGALSGPSERVYVRPSHRSWCENRYRSYRAYDNTFQPNNGPRRQCVSPY